MKGRPILFSGAMVRAILAGTKFQTRRLVTKSTSEVGSARWEQLDIAKALPQRGNSKLMAPLTPLDSLAYGDDTTLHRVYPRWQAGERLWVREAWCSAYARGCWGTVFRADDQFVQGKRAHERGPHFNAEWEVLGPQHYKWRSPLYLPRWASRLTLGIVGVRVQRLHDISEEDARAEGVTPLGQCGCQCEGEKDDVDATHAPLCRWGDVDIDPDIEPHRAAYRVGWNSINGKRATWANNPFVWALSFRRICQCETDIEEPGPKHLPACPWNDPNHAYPVSSP